MSIFHKLNANQESAETYSDRKKIDPIEEMFSHYKERLLRETDLEKLLQLPTSQKKAAIERFINEMIAKERVVLSQDDRNKLVRMILNDTVGFGPLEPLLADDDLTEIMVNNPDEVYIEKNGQIHLTDIRFKDHDHIRHIIDRIIAPIGRRIDESSPYVDGRLGDGSRVNAAIPPVSINGPVITIRKFKQDPYTMDDLISFDTVPDEMAEFLEASTASKLNVIVSGGTGSGKTTLLNVLSAAIPQDERIITVEDMAELRLDRKNVVALEARPPNMEGKGEITIRDLVRNSLRMRPDRIVVGEVRGGEALDMLQAMNTGHEGSLTTIHANAPQDAMSRLEAMILMSNPSMTADVVRPYIASAINIVVQTSRVSDGSRKIVSIAEALDQGDRIELKEIYQYQRERMDDDGNVVGSFKPTGYVPECLKRMNSFGFEISEDRFIHEGVYS